MVHIGYKSSNLPTPKYSPPFYFVPSPSTSASEFRTGQIQNKFWITVLFRNYVLSNCFWLKWRQDKTVCKCKRANKNVYQLVHHSHRKCLCLSTCPYIVSVIVRGHEQFVWNLRPVLHTQKAKWPWPHEF